MLFSSVIFLISLVFVRLFVCAPTVLILFSIVVFYHLPINFKRGWLTR